VFDGKKAKIDILKGYWQVPLTERGHEVSFILPEGLCSYCLMSFGLRNAPATFQRLINPVVGLKRVTVYLDDVVVGETWEHSPCLPHTGMAYGLATVMYLGMVLGHGQMDPIFAKVRAIVPHPSHKDGFNVFPQNVWVFICSFAKTFPQLSSL